MASRPLSRQNSRRYNQTEASQMYTAISGTRRRSSSCKSLPPNITATSATGAGAADEEMFLKGFELVPRIMFYTGRELEEELTRARECLASSGTDWEKRVECLKRIRSLIVAGAADYDEFYAHLRLLEIPFQLCVKDLRSQVVREACITIAYIAQKTKIRCERFCELLLPTLIALIANSAKIMSTSAVVCMRFVTDSVHAHRFIPVITYNMTSKSIKIRRACIELISQLLLVWPTTSMERHVGTLQETIKKGISDADSEVRTASRHAFWAFANHFRDQAHILLNSLDHAKQKTLQSEGGYGVLTGPAVINRNQRPTRPPVQRSRAGSTYSEGSSENLAQRPASSMSTRRTSNIPVFSPKEQVDAAPSPRSRTTRNDGRGTVSLSSSRSSSPSSRTRNEFGVTGRTPQRAANIQPVGSAAVTNTLTSASKRILVTAVAPNRSPAVAQRTPNLTNTPSELSGPPSLNGRKSRSTSPAVKSRSHIPIYSPASLGAYNSPVRTEHGELFQRRISATHNHSDPQQSVADTLVAASKQIASNNLVSMTQITGHTENGHKSSSISASNGSEPVDSVYGGKGFSPTSAFASLTLTDGSPSKSETRAACLDSSLTKNGVQSMNSNGNFSVDLSVIISKLSARSHATSSAYSSTNGVTSSDSERDREVLTEVLELVRSPSAMLYQNEWSQHFDRLLIALLDKMAATNSYPNFSCATRSLVLRVLCELIMRQTDHFTDHMIERTIQTILEMSRDGEKEVQRAAEVCGGTAAALFPPKLIIQLLTPVIVSGQSAPCLAAIKMVSRLIEQQSKSIITCLLPDLMPALVEAYGNPESLVRKAAVFCMVSVYLLVGEDMKRHLTGLSPSKMKLLNLYIDRAKCGSGASMPPAPV